MDSLGLKTENMKLGNKLMEDNREETGKEGMGMDLIKTHYSMFETTRILSIIILAV